MQSTDIVMNPYHDGKIFWPYHTQKAMTILRDEVPAPSLIEIDPTDGACNQACIHCCFGSGPHRKMISVDVELLLRFVSEAYDHGTYAYELVGGGEPTNHRHIADIISDIASLAKPDSERPHIGMVTNGVRLERVFAVAQHLDFVRVSLDAPDATVYNPLHGISPESNHFSKVITNIKGLIDIVGSKRVRIGYLVVPPHNHERNTILATAEFAHSLDAEHVAFRPAFLEYPTSREMWREAAKAIGEAKRKYRHGFIFGGVGGSWEYAVGNRNHPTGVCRTRPLVLVIKADGTIPSCFLYRERLAERPAIGHISQGFRNVWYSEHHRQSIQAVDRITCPEFCKLYRAENALEQLEMSISSSVAIPVLKDAELDNPHFI